MGDTEVVSRRTQSESHAELLPEAGFEPGPSADGIVVHAAGVGVDERGAEFGRGGSGYVELKAGEAVEGALLDLQDVVEEDALGVLPHDGGELVSTAELPEGGSGLVGVLSAAVVGFGQAGGAAEDGYAGALAGVVEREPADTAHVVGQPAAELGDVGVGAPGDGDGTAELNGAGGEDDGIGIRV